MQKINMKLTDKQIRSIMQKDITCKSMLVLSNELDEVIQKHLNDGWELVNKTLINERYKITFRKVK